MGKVMPRGLELVWLGGARLPPSRLDFPCRILPIRLMLLFSHWVMSDSSVTPRTVFHQAPLSVGFSKQEYWSRWPFPSPGNLLNPGTKPVSPALTGGFFTTEPPGKLPDFSSAVIQVAEQQTRTTVAFLETYQTSWKHIGASFPCKGFWSTLICPWKNASQFIACSLCPEWYHTVFYWWVGSFRVWPQLFNTSHVPIEEVKSHIVKRCSRSEPDPWDSATAKLQAVLGCLTSSTCL